MLEYINTHTHIRNEFLASELSCISLPAYNWSLMVSFFHVLLYSVVAFVCFGLLLLTVLKKLHIWFVLFFPLLICSFSPQIKALSSPSSTIFSQDSFRALYNTGSSRSPCHRMGARLLVRADSVSLYWTLCRFVLIMVDQGL